MSLGNHYPPEQSSAVVEALLAKLLSRLPPESVPMGRATVRVRLGDGRHWLLDLRLATVRAGAEDDALTGLCLSEADLLSLTKGRIRPADMYQRGRLSVDGDMTLARLVAGALYRLSANDKGK